MTPAKDVTTHRKLVTYGKSSQKAQHWNGFQSSTTPTRTQAPDTWPEEHLENPASLPQSTATGVRKTTIKDRQGHQRYGALQTPKLAKPSRPNSLRRPTPSYGGEEKDVYDFALSGDELEHEGKEPWRKRRKIVSPKDEWVSNGFEEIIIPRAKHATKRHSRHDLPNPSATTQSTPTKSPGTAGTTTSKIEVVILTPKKLRKHNEHSTKEGAVDEPNVNLPRRSKDPTTANSQTYQSSRQNPGLLSLLQQSQRTLKPAAPKLARPGKPAQQPQPKGSPLLGLERAASYPITTEVEDNIIGHTTLVSTTPSRRRIVDALSTTPRGRSESPIGPSDVGSRASSEVSTESSENSTLSMSQLPTASHGIQIRDLPDSPVPLPQSQGAGPKATYARQRSFLSVEHVTADLIAETPIQASFAQRYGGGASAGRGVSNSVSSKTSRPLATRGTGDDDDDSSSGVVRNIYELRRAGENARFEGIIDAIFEDIEDSKSSASRRYSGIIQLCTKLMDHQFTRRFLAHGLEKRLAKRAGDLSDAIYTYLIVCAYGIILSAGPLSSVVLHTCSTQVFKTIPKMVTNTSDIVGISKFGPTRTSKAVQASLRDFCDQLAQSKIWPDVKPNKRSPQILALRCIEMAVRRARESGDAMEYLSNDVLSLLVDLLLQHSVLPEQIQDAKTDDVLILELTFSVLESYTVALNLLEPSQEKILKRLSRLGPLLLQLSRYSEPCCRQIQLLEIRLILNLTNNNPSLCEDFSTPELIRALMVIVLSNFGLVSEDFGSDKRDSLLDAVILALGTLINLTEWNETARQLILQTRSGTTATTFLDRLLQLFKDGWEKTSEADSVVQTHSNVAFGYLSVLLSTVCLNEEARLHVRNSLQGRNIDRVLATVEEFLHYHRKVEKELQAGGGEHESVSGFTCRLQSIVDRIKQAEGIC
ncbi:hypothetical protein BDBG_07652 [Blastomyces gilchristii SLH14081]|uniref:Wings apart-like protein C-terminal domain-containing protein n=1 Tax=Blastomyces gilchristii (strain SLH14081) TaxID=559298 RepID=A0A179V112_BLAGS|nr:uncharacterized protein BDBG_07652 [Blastomyces gilchristii SLH14081]OAT12292.1 hypothetical protein BDBG_07652 [Blastomyces gilchristii SLH14081]